MTRSITLDDAEAVHGYVSRVCFKKGPPTRIGAELEFLLATLPLCAVGRVFI